MIKDHAPRKVVEIARWHRLSGHRISHLVGYDDHGGPIVDYESNPHGPLSARTTVALRPETHSSVLLVFESERSDRPIIVGLLEPEPIAPAQLEALVDGSRVCVDAQNELLLRCGDSSILLRRNGHILIRGIVIESHAKGEQRIKGGSVSIN